MIVTPGVTDTWTNMPVKDWDLVHEYSYNMQKTGYQYVQLPPNKQFNVQVSQAFSIRHLSVRVMLYVSLVVREKKCSVVVRL